MNKKPPYTIHSHLEKMELAQKNILLRADLNVPLKNGAILDTSRLTALQPTLNSLKKSTSHTLIITHIGRPKDHEESLSTKHLLPWFIDTNYDCVYAKNLHDAQKLLQTHDFVLFENIRFWPEEKKQSLSFAQQFKDITDIYVMDAFAVAHRNDTSLTLLPKLYSTSNRTIGLLVENELRELNKLLIKPKHPYMLLIGGAKIETKLPLIKNLLPDIDTIALLPPLSSLFEKNAPEVEEIKKIAQNLKKTILIPVDYIVTQTWEDQHSYTIKKLPNTDEFAVTIGPQTVDLYSKKLSSAHSLFFNGASGDIRYPKSCEAINTLLHNICSSSAFKVGSGGDTVAMINLCKKNTCFNFLSTGGGATLRYLSGQEMPGLLPFTQGFKN